MPEHDSTNSKSAPRARRKRPLDAVPAEDEVVLGCDGAHRLPPPERATQGEDAPGAPGHMLPMEA